MGAAYRPPGWLANSVADREQRLQVVLREHLEGDHRVGAADALELREPPGDERRERVGLAYAHDGDEVPFACHRVGLGHPFHVGELPAERRHRRALGLDQDDRVGHAEWVSPGARMTTFALVCDSTSLLNASASVSIGGNVP